MASIMRLSWIYKFRQQDSFYKEKENIMKSTEKYFAMPAVLSSLFRLFWAARPVPTMTLTPSRMSQDCRRAIWSSISHARPLLLQTRRSTS